MMEAEEAEGLELRFQRAADRMRSNSSLRLGNDQKLQLYGYFKQANEGTCNTPRPGFFDFTGRAKWEAWAKLGDLSKQEAMEKYLQLVDSLDPNWELQPTGSTGTDSGHLLGLLRGNSLGTPSYLLVTTQPPPTSGGSVLGGPVMSRCVEEKEEVIPDKLKTVFDWCKEGHLTNMVAMVTEENINETCENGLTLLHWACDRGHLEVVKFLVTTGADVNRQDPDQQTPLHYAASCDHHKVVSYLLSAGADRTIKDCDGYLAEEQASDPTTRQLFQQP